MCVQQSHHKKAKGQPALSKHEQRKAAKERRAAEWEAFMKTKPDDNDVNPDDAAAIREAEQNMGDFKLKSDKAYLPPPGQRMTAARKKQQVCTSLNHPDCLTTGHHPATH